MRASLTLMTCTHQSEAHHQVREEVEAEAVNMGERQVREQMFICRVGDLQAQRIAHKQVSKVEHYLCFFSNKHNF